MKIPRSWLETFIDLPQTDEELADILTLAGLEVDAIIKPEPSYSGVVVGIVESCTQHPDAERLKVATVSDGSESVQVVCGGANCREGIKVAFAKVGAKLSLPEGKTLSIKKSKLRGVESFGMLCAKEELGLEESSDGIMEIDSSVNLGIDVASLFDDTVFEISLTPNLGHCTSVLGIARELSAMTKSPLREHVLESSGDAPTPFSVTIETDDCARYACQKIDAVRVGPSPAWLIEKLEAVGIRSINTVVDITNYVMIECGQPMHAFDAELLTGEKISVRLSKDKEELITLDEVARTVRKDTLMIYDSTKPLAVAGVMGGHSTSVSEKTTSILFEAASFNPSSVRRSSKRLNLRTESSNRFEKGTDPTLPLKALARAVELLQEICEGCTVYEPTFEERIPIEKQTISFSVSRCNTLLGTELSNKEIEGLLSRLDMEVQADSRELTVAPPPYRNDVRKEIDLIEEVARLYGYNNIPRRKPRFVASPLPHAPIHTFEYELREKCIGLGLQEWITCDLISPEQAKIHTDLESIPVIQPSSVDQSILRTSLLPGMLACIRHNIDHGTPSVQAFELGAIHFKDKDSYKERLTLSFIMHGKDSPQSWHKEEREVDFFTAKGYVENMLASCGIDNARFEHATHTIFHPGIQANIIIDGNPVGAIGEVHPRHSQSFDIEGPVFYAECDVMDLLSSRETPRKMKALPQFPGSQRDWTVPIQREKQVAELLDAIKRVPSKLCKGIELLDVYESEKLGDLKNITLRFTYRSDTKTLQQEAVEKEHERITRESMKNFS